jgi:hypothetical protein
LRKDRSKLSYEQATDLNKLVAQFTAKRIARDFCDLARFPLTHSNGLTIEFW